MLISVDPVPPIGNTLKGGSRQENGISGLLRAMGSPRKRIHANLKRRIAIRDLSHAENTHVELPNPFVVLVRGNQRNANFLLGESLKTDKPHVAKVG